MFTKSSGSSWEKYCKGLSRSASTGCSIFSSAQKCELGERRLGGNTEFQSLVQSTQLHRPQILKLHVNILIIHRVAVLSVFLSEHTTFGCFDCKGCQIGVHSGIVRRAIIKRMNRVWEDSRGVGEGGLMQQCLWILEREKGKGAKSIHGKLCSVCGSATLFCPKLPSKETSDGIGFAPPTQKNHFPQFNVHGPDFYWTSTSHAFCTPHYSMEADFFIIIALRTTSHGLNFSFNHTGTFNKCWTVFHLITNNHLINKLFFAAWKW